MKFFLLLLTLVGLGCTNTKKSKTASMRFSDNIVVAHRGAWKKNSLPENSIASLREAVRLGCTGSEFDVHLTADDSLVVNHDDSYFGSKIGNTTYAALAVHKLSNGESLPLLEDYLTEGMKQHKTMLVLELKPSSVSKERGIQSAEKMMALVKKLKAEPWMMYISFDYDILKKIIELDPQAKTAYLNGEKSPLEVKRDGVWGVDYHLGIFNKHPDWIQEAKANQVNLNVWTVNAAADLQFFIDKQFNYITTNEPELLFTLLTNKSR